MTALAQGCAGAALVTGLAMLCTRQSRAVLICLAVQSATVIGAAIIEREPLMMLPPVATVAAIWRARLRTATPPRHLADRLPGVNPGIVAGGILALLCQSQGETGLPLAVVMLSVVLAATRPDPVTQLVALGAMQNGIALTGCLAGADGLLPFACLALPLPLAASLIARPHGIAAMARRRSPRPVGSWLGWAELGGAAALFAASVTVPLGPLAAIFAPLIAFDGMVRAWIARTRFALPAARRVTSLLELGFVLLAVCAPDPILAWLALTAAATAALLPTVVRSRDRGHRYRGHWDRAVLAYVAAGLALFGLLTLPVEPSPVAYLSLFAGYATLAAVVPDLAIPLLVVVLRFADQAAWPPTAGVLGTGIALIALLTCSSLLARSGGRHCAVLLRLAQASMAALAIATLQPDGRFAAVVLLVLLSLTRTAARATGGPAGVLAIAGLAGIPPLGVFPGLGLAVLAVGGHVPWLLLPLGIALVPIVVAGLPGRLRVVSLRTAVLSAGWLPLALALLFGFFAPDGLVRWLSALTGGPS